MEAEAAPSRHKRDSSVGSVASGSPDEKRELFEFFGWVFHHGFNSIGHEYCHLRFLFIRGKHVEMYKRDPSENPDIKPIRRGVISPSLMVEELGRRKVNDNDIYIIRFYNRQDERKKGEIACATAGEAKKWMEAFDHARQQAVYELSKGGGARDILNVETEINLEGHRPRVRRYAHELKKLIRIGQGPETLLRRSSNVGDMYFHSNAGDAIEANNWKCLRTIKGISIVNYQKGIIPIFCEMVRFYYDIKSCNKILGETKRESNMNILLITYYLFAQHLSMCCLIHLFFLWLNTDSICYINKLHIINNKLGEKSFHPQNTYRLLWCRKTRNPLRKG
ncbi:hypothetical protein SAY86_026576 [Trapa natans]|uniref:PH domain-containing protein n=1 Tax=Trapa natans TaxID=22666 RepID=A0AAN7KK07_TRANT|nr:hypothetical protein SAY86_026576 [Trapa natans]